MWGKRPGKATQLHFCTPLCPPSRSESVRLQWQCHPRTVPTLDVRTKAPPNLVGCPIHPALGIGINVDENKTFNCVRVGQLRDNRKEIRSRHSFVSASLSPTYPHPPPTPTPGLLNDIYSLPCSLFPSKTLEFQECGPCLQYSLQYGVPPLPSLAIFASYSIS